MIDDEKTLDFGMKETKTGLTRSQKTTKITIDYLLLNKKSSLNTKLFEPFLPC